jgi:hypothetical protein
MILKSLKIRIEVIYLNIHSFRQINQLKNKHLKFSQIKLHDLYMKNISSNELEKIKYYMYYQQIKYAKKKICEI